MPHHPEMSCVRGMCAFGDRVAQTVDVLMFWAQRCNVVCVVYVGDVTCVTHASLRVHHAAVGNLGF